MADIFFRAGMLKFNNYLNGRWEETVLFFTDPDYHPIPGVPGEIAAIAGTAGELILPVLLAFGLFTRFGAAGLLVMTLVIQFWVGAHYEHIANPDHYMWMLLLAVPMLKGGGMLSADFILCKLFCKKSA